MGTVSPTRSGCYFNLGLFLGSPSVFLNGCVNVGAPGGRMVQGRKGVERFNHLDERCVGHIY